MIQDDQSQYTINKTLQRLQQNSDKGSVNITGLPAGEYSVRVYDNNISPATDTAAAAYEHFQLIHIIAFTGPRSVNVLSTYSHSVYTQGAAAWSFDMNCVQYIFTFMQCLRISTTATLSY